MEAAFNEDCNDEEYRKQLKKLPMNDLVDMLVDLRKHKKITDVLKEEFMGKYWNCGFHYWGVGDFLDEFVKENYFKELLENDPEFFDNFKKRRKELHDYLRMPFYKITVEN